MSKVIGYRSFTYLEYYVKVHSISGMPENFSIIIPQKSLTEEFIKQATITKCKDILDALLNFHTTINQ